MGESKSKPKVTEVPDGHRRVRIVYNPNKDLVGKIVDLPADEAKSLVIENRVAYVDKPDQTPLSDVDDDVVAEQVAVSGGSPATPPRATTIAAAPAAAEPADK